MLNRMCHFRQSESGKRQLGRFCARSKPSDGSFGVCVQDAQAAAALLQEWSSISVDEALYMLTGSFTHPAVRARAVAVLQQQADDNMIYDYLIQLVQCVRHDGQGDTAPLAGALACSCNDFCSCCCMIWILDGMFAGHQVGMLCSMQEAMHCQLYSSLSGLICHDVQREDF